jgi:hypothetical protein
MVPTIFFWFSYSPRAGLSTTGGKIMGLDCYWAKPGESKSQPLDFDPPLCFEDEYDHQERREGWAFCAGSRQYQHAIRQITGISLRVSTRPRLLFWRSNDGTSVLTSRAVLQIAERLEAFAEKPWPLPSSEMRRGWEAFSAKEYRDIARMFRAYGEAGYQLIGSF